MAPLQGKRYCWSHHPSTARARAEARRLGGINRRRLVEVSLGQLQQASGEAVETLRRNLGDGLPPSVQVRAALGVLKVATEAVDLADLAGRLEELEAAVELLRRGGE